MLISVIIPTRNRAKVLADALAALAGQDAARDAYEVLVVDNGSTDETAGVAASARAQVPALRYVLEPSPGLHSGRHRGMREAGGEVLAYIDDDVQVGPRWIASLRSAFKDESVALVGGNNLPRFAAPPPAWLQYLWDRRRTVPYLSIIELAGEARDIDPSFVWGCNFSIRKQALLEAGGFHPDAMPQELIKFRGDGEMGVGRRVAKSGKRCLFHPGATVQHLVPAERMTYAYFRRRAFLQGVSDSYTALRAEHRHEGGAAPGYGRIAGYLSWAMRLRPLGWQLARLEAEAKRGYDEGVRYHRAMYESDPEMRAWVLRETYL